MLRLSPRTSFSNLCLCNSTKFFFQVLVKRKVVCVTTVNQTLTSNIMTRVSSWLWPWRLTGCSTSAPIILIIKVFIKCKIVSLYTILGARARVLTHTRTHARTHSRAHTHTCTRARAHTHTHTHEYTDCKNLTYTLLKQTTETWGGWRQQRGTENMAGLLFCEKKCLEVWLEGGFLSYRKGKGHSS